MPPSDHVYQGDPITMQCSLLSNTEKKTCSGNHSVFWFRAGTDQSQPSLIYAHGNTGDECNKSAEDPSQYKCDKCEIYILLIYYDAIYLNKCLLTCKGGFPSFFCLTCIFHHLNHSLMHQCNLKHFNKIDLCEPQNIGRQTDVQ